MGLAAEKPRYSIQDYLTRERTALDKHEYRDGEILVMSGGTVNHSLVIANVIAGLHTLLRKATCNVFDSNLRVRIPRTILYTYPDVTVICGGRQMDLNDPSGETVTNPKVIVEVISPSTEAYDRGEKFNRYRLLDSLDEYVLISLASPGVENYWRQPAAPDESGKSDGERDGDRGGERVWLFTATHGLEAQAKFRSLDVSLALAEIYRGVEFSPADAPAAHG